MHKRTNFFEPLPQVGLGTFKSPDGSEVYNAVQKAIDVGYRHIDTATAYQNEQGVGAAIKDHSVSRNDLFITTKVPNPIHTFDGTIETVHQSLEKLQTNYIDLLLIHWPTSKKRNADLWTAFEQLKTEGKVKHIGVSNFQIHHLQDLFESAKIPPVCNQVELHPYLQQWALQRFCWAHDIAMISYGPFAKGQVDQDPVLLKIAKKHGKTLNQVIIRWGLQREIHMIPKSVTGSRIESNFDLFDFELSDDEMKEIRALNRATRLYSDPDNINYDY